MKRRERERKNVETKGCDGDGMMHTQCTHQMMDGWMDGVGGRSRVGRDMDGCINRAH